MEDLSDDNYLTGPIAATGMAGLGAVDDLLQVMN